MTRYTTPGIAYAQPISSQKLDNLLELDSGNLMFHLMEYQRPAK